MHGHSKGELGSAYQAEQTQELADRNLDKSSDYASLVVQGMKEAYQVYMDTLREELGSAPPVALATVAQRAQDSAEGMHSQTRVLQGLAIGMLLILLLLTWNVLGLRKTSRQQLQLLKQLAEASVRNATQHGGVIAEQCRSTNL